ncbi:MAG: VOC family protein [Thermomicrobiales bacterium]
MSFPGLIVMPVTDIEKARTTYRALLGVDPYVKSEYYVGFHAGESEIGLDPNGKVGPLPYWDVQDVDEAIGRLKATGATVIREPEEVGGGLTIAVLADLDGNPIGLRQTGVAPSGTAG